MKSVSYFLTVCCLLMLGCNKDNNTPEGEEETNGKGTYFEATIDGPVVKGDFKWDGSNTLAMEEQGDGIGRAVNVFGYSLGEVRKLWGGITIPPGTGTYKVAFDDGEVSVFEVEANGVAFIQQDMTVKVTDYKVVEGGTAVLRQIERIYGTFEGTVQTLAQTADQESGIVHTVKGKFGYKIMD
ncbi:hypothetical protein [Parapedobacter sp. 2B3]|uniref:hypothetical protein n=1 Tax=Parapedobacter sp. 2B3 TaxID=3342381 RepID=UPI0035B69745